MGNDVPKIVVAGVASLYMAMGVEEFPLCYRSACSPTWLGTGVSGAGHRIAQILQTLGNEVRLCTVVGRDLPGILIRAELLAAGLLGPGAVDVRASSLGVTLVAPDGRHMGYPYLAALNSVEYPEEVFLQIAHGAELAVLTNTRFARSLPKYARQLSIPIAVDVHHIADINDVYNRPWMQAADILFCSHERLPCPPSEWVRQIFVSYPRCSVVGIGCGGDGCVLGLRSGLLAKVDAVAPRAVVNTAGAGDTLFASFLHSWLTTGNAVRAVEQAVLYAGWKVGGKFSWDALLTTAELDQLRAVYPVRATVGRWGTRRPAERPLT